MQQYATAININTSWRPVLKIIELISPLIIYSEFKHIYEYLEVEL